MAQKPHPTFFVYGSESQAKELTVINNDPVYILYPPSLTLSVHEDNLLSHDMDKAKRGINQSGGTLNEKHAGRNPTKVVYGRLDPSQQWHTHCKIRFIHTQAAECVDVESIGKTRAQLSWTE